MSANALPQFAGRESAQSDPQSRPTRPNQYVNEEYKKKPLSPVHNTWLLQQRT